MADSNEDAAVVQFRQIVASRDAALDRLSTLETPSLTKANELVNKKNRGQALTQDEKDELASLRAFLDEIHHAMWIVGQVSLQAMNDSALLRDLKNSLEGISGDLRDAKTRLKKIGEVADTSAQAAQALAALADKLVSAAGPAALLT